MEDHQKPSDEERKAYSQADREKMAKSGEALPDGSFPIANESDLKNAVQAYGRASNQAAAKAHIIKRAKALGLTSLLPDGWEQNAAEDEVEEREDVPELEHRRRKAELLRGAMEHREFTTANMECRELPDGTLRMSGYASITEQPYEVGPFTETIRRGAFKRTLSESPDTVLLINHEGAPLARTKNGSLVLTEDARGLQWTADLDSDDPDSVALARRVGSGLLDQCSFAFLCTDDEWSEDYKQRTVKSLSIHRGDVSVVTHGANPATSVGLRSMLVELEERAGKTLSAKTRGELETAQELISGLLSGSDAAEEPEGAPEATPTEAALEAVAEQTEEIAREADEPPEKAVLVPDGKRERERLAALRRAA